MLMGLDTFYHTGTCLSRAAIALSLVAMIGIFCTLYRNMSGIPRSLSRAVPKTKCVIYDRPPRTGSTTVSKALGSCMRSKGYRLSKNGDRNRSKVVMNMFSLETDRMAIAGPHVAMSGNDVELLEENCGEMLYITSASPMKERLFSALKYKELAKRTGDPHSNETIEVDMVAMAKKNSTRTQLRELYLEAYPHVAGRDLSMLDVVPERIVPDYVILKKSLGRDLQAMLDALGCNTPIKTINAHKSNSDEDMVLESIELHSGDAIHSWLTEVAKNNDKGLRKARKF